MAASDLQRVIETASARARHEVERFQAETAFAESLCELHPDQAVDWQPLLAKARELVSEAVAEGGVDGLLHCQPANPRPFPLHSVVCPVQ